MLEPTVKIVKAERWVVLDSLKAAICQFEAQLVAYL
jgi:hypothetical protein